MGSIYRTAYAVDKVSGGYQGSWELFDDAGESLESGTVGGVFPTSAEALDASRAAAHDALSAIRATTVRVVE